MLKPTDILKITEPVELMYMDCTSQLLINLSRHFSTDTALETTAWETKKLSELGALTEESIEIIAANTGKAPEAIQKAITEGMGLELKDAEKTLAGAAAKGVIQGPTVSVEASEGVRSVVKNLTDQATNDANIVNTVMLQSTQMRYVNAVQYAAREEAALIEQLQNAQDLAQLTTQLETTQKALNASAMSVATGAEARTTALRRTIAQLASEGITGYVDAGGHHWTPEAYINMDLRTTVHNAAVQGQKARSADYGVTTFQISSHAGARPLCAPYQGKIYSWDGSSGTIEDLYGRKYHYESIKNTSYGEPAGIFGINCGHRPETFVPGYSIPRYEPTQDEAKNAEQYRLSQQQRYMERQIRDEKTRALCYNAAGDKEAFDQSALRIKEKNAQYKAFCNDNDLTQRLERTQVVGYNRNVSAKANAAATRQAKVAAEETARKQERSNYINNVKPTLPKNNVPLSDTTLQQTLSVDVLTKGNYELHSIAPTGADLTSVRIIAGYGTSTNFRNAQAYVDAYGGEDYKWRKVGGLIETDNFVYDVHWVQNNGNAMHYDYKIKGVKEKK